MSDESTPAAKKSGGALIVVFAILAVLIVGIGGIVVGVIGDRFYLSITKRTPDARLIGTWVDENGGSIQFHDDGTYDADNVPFMLGNKTAQYRWLDRETIDTGGWEGPWKLVFKGDQLTAKFSTGGVVRLTRKSERSPEAKDPVE